MTVRPTWAQTWLAVAQTIAFRSKCIRAQVGAVIVTGDNRVAAVSYNGPARGHVVYGDCSCWCPRAKSGDTSSSYDSCPSIHAEANALLRANWTDIQGGTIYISTATCINCARLIANSGLSHLVHVVGQDSAHRDPGGTEEYLRKCGLSVARSERIEEL